MVVRQHKCLPRRAPFSPTDRMPHRKRTQTDMPGRPTTTQVSKSKKMKFAKQDTIQKSHLIRENLHYYIIYDHYHAGSAYCTPVGIWLYIPMPAPFTEGGYDACGTAPRRGGEERGGGCSAGSKHSSSKRFSCRMVTAFVRRFTSETQDQMLAKGQQNKNRKKTQHFAGVVEQRRLASKQDLATRCQTASFQLRMKGLGHRPGVPEPNLLGGLGGRSGADSVAEHVGRNPCSVHFSRDPCDPCSIRK